MPAAPFKGHRAVQGTHRGVKGIRVPFRGFDIPVFYAYNTRG